MIACATPCGPTLPAHPRTPLTYPLAWERPPPRPPHPLGAAVPPQPASAQLIALLSPLCYTHRAEEKLRRRAPRKKPQRLGTPPSSPPATPTQAVLFCVDEALATGVDLRPGKLCMCEQQKPEFVLQREDVTHRHNILLEGAKDASAYSYVSPPE
jgi:hypothetical protein